MRRTKEEAEQTRADILACALEMFARRGYAASRLDDVAAAAGVTRGAVYFHFRDKVALYRAALEAPSARIAAAMTAALNSGERPAVRLERWFMAVLDLADTDPEVRAAFEIQWLRTEALEEFSEDLAAKRGSAERLVSMLAAVIRQGVAEREFVPGSSPTALATGLVALLTGLLQGWILDESIPLRRRGRVIIRNYLKGFGDGVSGG